MILREIFPRGVRLARAIQRGRDRSPDAAPGPLGRPILGSLAALREDPLRLFLEAAREHGDVVRFQLGPHTAHLVRDPEGIKHVLQDNNKNYDRQTPGYHALSEALGNGLITSEGAFWQRQRRIVQPAFHRQRIAGFATLMADAARQMTDRWAREARETPVDIVQELLRVTLQIIGLAMLGHDLSGEAGAIGRAVAVMLDSVTERASSIFGIPRFLPTPGNLRFKEAMATIDGLVAQLMAQRRREGAGRPDLLSMLLDARDEETDETMNEVQLRDELVTMIGAGHETTAMSLSWTFVLLSRYPAARRRLEAEIDEVLGDRVPTLADIPKLVFTKMVIEESMRIYPPAWMIGRHAIHADVIGGYPIPADSIVFVSPWVTHRSPNIWEDPEGFDPDRFAPGKEAARHRYAYFPFGGGPHLCVGNAFALMEATLVLATITQRFRLDLVPGHPIVPEPLITLRPKHGVLAWIRPRPKA